MRILIVGSGNMGKTYARSFLTSRVITSADLFVLDKSREQVDALTEVLTDNVFDKPGLFIAEADVVILAVKPQDFAGLAEHIKAFIKQRQLILSIMAGIKIDTISQLLGATRIVRCMPNLPAQIGMGMTVFTSSPGIDKKELFTVQNLINTTGKSIYVEDEGMIDAATAISGSGPAYVYYFMEAMIQAGVKMGFSLSQAELLVNQTFMGAVHLHNQNELTCEEWIKKVASRGGTTEAAIKVFNANSVNGKIEEGLVAAFERAKELGS
jgi:pyrroline-5-carboxylate reductase